MTRCFFFVIPTLENFDELADGFRHGSRRRWGEDTQLTHPRGTIAVAGGPSEFADGIEAGLDERISRSTVLNI